LLNYTHDVLPISTLVEENVHGEVGNEISNRWDSFKCYISQAWVLLIFGRKIASISKVKLFPILTQALPREVKKMSPAAA
jgi:hypothetical protein